MASQRLGQPNHPEKEVLVGGLSGGSFQQEELTGKWAFGEVVNSLLLEVS